MDHWTGHKEPHGMNSTIGELAKTHYKLFQVFDIVIAFPCIYFLFLVLCSYVLIQFVISNRRQIIRIKNSTEIFRTLKSNL